MADSNTAITATMKTEIAKISALADGVVTARETADTGFSNAQSLFAKRCAGASIKFNADEYEAICAGIVGPNKERKQKATDARHWGHPSVAKKIDTIFSTAETKSGGKSVYGFAYKMGTLLKTEGNGINSPTGAAQSVVASVESNKAALKTPKGAQKHCIASVKRHLKEGGYQPDDIAPVIAAINALGEPSKPVAEAVVAPTPVAEVAASEALASVSDAEADNQLGAMLSGLLQTKGMGEAEASMMAALLTK
jgi:hypothetical protein